jgi:tRNA (cmo5U34)-methyltransferase
VAEWLGGSLQNSLRRFEPVLTPQYYPQGNNSNFTILRHAEQSANTLMNIQEQFNSISKKYDAQRPFLIPCYTDFYTIALPLILSHKKAKRLLDIGAGTGLFSRFIYQQRPDLDFTLADISAEMLNVAKERFSGLDNFDFIELDFSNTAIEKKYDIIVSALAIHHLEDDEKERLFASVYQALNHGGLFINADQVEGRSPLFDGYYKTEWKETVNSSGLEQDAIDRAMERIKLDKFAKLDTQLTMLDRAGFNDADCIYKHNNFVVFAGLKA